MERDYRRKDKKKEREGKQTINEIECGEDKKDKERVEKMGGKRKIGGNDRQEDK